MEHLNNCYCLSVALVLGQPLCFFFMLFLWLCLSVFLSPDGRVAFVFIQRTSRALSGSMVADSLLFDTLHTLGAFYESNFNCFFTFFQVSVQFGSLGL